MKNLRLAAALSLCAGLSACGVYVSSRVSDRTEGLDVRVIALSAETVLMANSAPYAPRTLPDVFYQTAGAGGAIRGAGALPDAPPAPDLDPPTLELRAPPAQNAGPYRLGTGDVLRMSIASGQTIDPITGETSGDTRQQDMTVRDDGAVSIPQVGTVPVAGLSVEEAEATLFERLISAGIDPTFSLEVVEFNARRLSVGGAVREAQVIPLTPGGLRLSEALARAGGVTADDAAFAAIRIYRDGQLYQIPLDDFLARADLQSLPVLSGDAVFVDTTYDLDRAQRFYESQINVIALRRNDRAAALAELTTEIELRRSALAEARQNFLTREDLGAVDRDYVYLAGEVRNQSRWALPFGQQASLADVLYDSGGFSTETGNPAQIYVLRAATDPDAFGAVTAWHLDARNAAAFTLAPRFEMRPDDVIFVEEQPITTWNRTIQQSIPSLLGTVGAAASGG
jgi:polysaccharide biosynthesis/export protein